MILDIDAIEKHAERLCEVDPTTDRTYVPELQASVIALVRLVRADGAYRSAVRHMHDIERLAEEERVADGAQQIVESNEQWSALLAASAAATKAEEALVAAGGTPRLPSFNIYEADGVPWERGDVRAAPGVPPGVSLFELAAKLPCRTLHGVNGPYLSRYTLTKLEDGAHVFLHFFHRGDEDEELHNHPWSGTSFLKGGYAEERRQGSLVVTRVFRPGDVSTLSPDTFHRVDLLNPAEGCWTLFIAGAREQSWGFWDRRTGDYTPWARVPRAAR